MLVVDWLAPLRSRLISPKRRTSHHRRKRRFISPAGHSAEVLESRIALGDVFGVSAFLGGGGIAAAVPAALGSPSPAEESDGTSDGEGDEDLKTTLDPRLLTLDQTESETITSGSPPVQSVIVDNNDAAGSLLPADALPDPLSDVFADPASLFEPPAPNPSGGEIDERPPLEIDHEPSGGGSGPAGGGGGGGGGAPVAVAADSAAGGGGAPAAQSAQPANHAASGGAAERGAGDPAADPAGDHAAAGSGGAAVETLVADTASSQPQTPTVPQGGGNVLSAEVLDDLLTPGAAGSAGDSPLPPRPHGEITPLAAEPDPPGEHHPGHNHDSGDHAQVQGTPISSRPSVRITAGNGGTETSGPIIDAFQFWRDDVGSGGGTDNLVVHFTVGGTATEGKDYDPINRQVTIPGGQMSVSITIDPIDDTKVEGDEYILIKLIRDPVGEDYNRDSPEIAAQVTIGDDDCSGGGCPQPPRIDLSMAEVHANRTQPIPLVEDLYEIKGGEHFDAGSTFNFQLVAAFGDMSTMRYELFPTDPVISGPGLSFSHTVGEGTFSVRFYDDANGNSEQDAGEASIHSSIVVKERVHQDLWVDVSSKLPGVGSAEVWDVFNGAGDILVKKDSEFDWRAIVALRPVKITTFTATGDTGPRPDPVPDDFSQRQKHYNADAYIVLVETLEVYLGINNENDYKQIIVEWGTHSNLKRSIVVAHEFGHGVGLSLLHEGYTERDVMFGENNNKNFELNEGDVGNYETQIPDEIDP